MMIGRRNRSTPRKSAPVPLCPPQIPHDLTEWEPGPATNCLIYGTYLNTFIELFKKFFKRVSKGLQRNGVPFGRHVFLNVFNILKLLSFEGSFHLRKEKNAAKETVVVLISLDEVLA
jgi:hypothetical protein